VKRTQFGAWGVLLGVVVVACGGDDSSSNPAGGGESGHGGSNGTAGSGVGGSSNSGGSLILGTSGSNEQGGNGGAAVGGSAGSAGTGGNGGTPTPDAGTDGGAKNDANADVSTTNDAPSADTSAETASSVDTGTPIEASSDALGPADSGIDVGTALSCDAGEGLQLKFVPGLNSSGWIDRSTNCVGIQGASYIVPDGGGSTAYFTSTTNHLCVSGQAKHSAVLDATHWGVTVAVQLNNNGVAEIPYDATAYGVTGFDFTLSGASIPAIVRATYRVDGQGTEYCKELGGAGAKSVLFTDTRPQCYMPDAGTAVPTASQLIRLEFIMPSNTTTDVNFDFCIDNLTAKKQ